MSGLLVIDDDFAFLETLVLLFEGEGYRARKAGDGAEGLERLAEEPAELVICDVMMPVMSGLTLLTRMAADPRFRSIPVLLVTGSYRALPPGLPPFVAMLRKPFLFDSLLAVVRGVVPPPAEPVRG